MFFFYLFGHLTIIEYIINYVQNGHVPAFGFSPYLPLWILAKSGYPSSKSSITLFSVMISDQSYVILHFLSPSQTQLVQCWIWVATVSRHGGRLKRQDNPWMRSTWWKIWSLMLYNTWSCLICRRIYSPPNQEQVCTIRSSHFSKIVITKGLNNELTTRFGWEWVKLILRDLGHCLRW